MTIDISGKIGPLYPQMYMSREWPMYSYATPSWMLWNAIAKELHENGWTEDQIKEYLQSKQTRWDLNGKLAEKIEKLGRKWAKKMIKAKETKSSNLIKGKSFSFIIQDD